jgi:hypothetical protein
LREVTVQREQKRQEAERTKNSPPE